MSERASVCRVADGLIYSFPDASACIPPHTHEEISHYSYVLSGTFKICCESGEYLAKPGDFIDFKLCENHCLLPQGKAAVFNRFHKPCNPDQLAGLLNSDLANLEGAAMKKSTQELLLVAGAAALLFYFFSKKAAACPNADMGGQNFGVKCPQSWC